MTTPDRRSGKSARGDDRLARVLLVAGAAVGIALAAIGIVRSGELDLVDPPGAIAVVNGRPIGRESFARFAAAVAAERKSMSLDTATRRRLLQRMLDEELLLQRGVELDLHRLEHTARRSTQGGPHCLFGVIEQRFLVDLNEALQIRWPLALCDEQR